MSQATPNEVLAKLNEYKTMEQSAQAHSGMIKRGLVDLQTKTKIATNAQRTRAQLIQMVGDNPVAQALLNHIIGG